MRNKESADRYSTTRKDRHKSKVKERLRKH
jgi:hypothetical protein